MTKKRVILCEGKVVKVKKCPTCQIHSSDEYEMDPDDGYADYSFGSDGAELVGKRVKIVAEVL